jgi:hypothetical protein
VKKIEGDQHERFTFAPSEFKLQSQAEKREVIDDAHTRMKQLYLSNYRVVELHDDFYSYLIFKSLKRILYKRYNLTEIGTIKLRN